MNSGIRSSWDRSINSGNHEAACCSGAIRITLTPSDWAIFCRTWGTVLNDGNADRSPLPLSQGMDLASVHSALGSGYGETNLMSHLLVKVANKSTCGLPHLANTGRRRSMAIVHSVFSVWPTLDRESAWMLCTPGRWTGTNVIALRSHHLSSRMVIDRVPPHLMWATVTVLSHIKRTTRDLRCGRKSLTVSMTACISRTLMCHNLWDADHCPHVERKPNWAPQPELDASVKRVTSVSLAARGRPCRTAGDAHQATSDRTHCRTVIWSDQLPVLWHHVLAAPHWTGRRRSLPLPVVPAKPWTPTCREACADLWLWCSDWSSSVDERPGLLDASSVGAPLWIVERWTASRWTGSPDLEWGPTSRSLWSSRETGAHRWSSGRAVWPVPICSDQPVV